MNLKAVLECLVTILESNHRRLDELGKAVFALQAAVRGLDPTFDDTLKVKADEIDEEVAHLEGVRRSQYAELHKIIDSL